MSILTMLILKPPLGLGYFRHSRCVVDVSHWLQMILAPGFSLGGARPKANVKDADGHLWIAKFPSRHDKKNIGAWEAVTMNLAKQCHINIAPFEAKTLALGLRFTIFPARNRK